MRQKLNKFISLFYKYLWNFIVNIILASNMVPLWLRNKIYILLGMKILSPYIHSNVFFGSNNIYIGGNNSFINKGCVFDNESGALIKIGNNCAVSYEVMFCTSTHEVGDYTRRSGKSIAKDIVVNDGCWIGARTTILPGVEIGKGCIIAAGSVVTQNCKKNGLYAGVPAVRKKDLV